MSAVGILKAETASFPLSNSNDHILLAIKFIFF